MDNRAVESLSNLDDNGDPVQWPTQLPLLPLAIQCFGRLLQLLPWHDAQHGVEIAIVFLDHV
jgi:hypothetical protein